MLFSELLTRKDLSHLLLSDIENMLVALAKEFPDIIKVYSIGDTWQQRPIQVIELDARKLMEMKGVVEDVEVTQDDVAKASTALKKEKATKTVSLTETVEEKKEKSKSVDELSEYELIERNEDADRAESQKKKDKQDKFNSISEEDK